MKNEKIDVLVVGAGPVGLFCANELARYGLTCHIFDKKSGLSDKSKALGIHIRTLDVLDDCGFLNEFLAAGHRVVGATLKSHEKELANVTLTDIEANYHFLLDLPQSETEAILNEFLLQKEIEVAWENELTEIRQGNEGVFATITKPDGSSHEIFSSWVIACDGSHSTLRHLSGYAFEGSEYPLNWWLADLLIDWKMPEDQMIFYLDKHGPLACFPMGHKRYRLVMTVPSEDIHDPDLIAIENIFKERSGETARLYDPIWITKFFIHHRQIKNYRWNRVFFAGDAAHIHSPMGGQGLNTGIQDIYNLIWKLSLVNKNFAKEKLLDSYHEERYPIGREVLQKTDIMTKMVSIKSSQLISIRNKFIKWLMSFKTIKKKLARNIAELEISYANSSIVKNIGHTGQLKAGFFLTNFNLFSSTDKKSYALNQIARGTAHHLFLFSGIKTEKPEKLISIAKKIQEEFANLIQVHIILSQTLDVSIPNVSIWYDEQKKVHKEYAINKPTLILLRPDKYIGFAQTPINEEELFGYLEINY